MTTGPTADPLALRIRRGAKAEAQQLLAERYGTGGVVPWGIVRAVAAELGMSTMPVGAALRELRLTVAKRQAAPRPASPPRHRVTHCGAGHELVGDNALVLRNGYRACRTCALEAVHRYRARKKQEGRG